MTNKRPIHTDAAPAAIGPYSQAIRAGTTVYLSGQIPLDPVSQEIAGEEFSVQAKQVFDNLAAVAAAAGGSLDDIVKLTVYLIDLSRFAELNAIMQQYFKAPFPARAAIEVSALPRNVQVEVDAIMVRAD